MLRHIRAAGRESSDWFEGRTHAHSTESPYDRDNTVSKEPNPDTIVTQQINDHWWFLSEDWN
jgi:hypothetical protein